MMFCWINITRSLFSCISSKCISLIIILKSLTLSNGFLKLFGLCCLTCRLQCLKKLPLLFAQCDAPLCFQREANRVWREQFMSTSDAAAVYQDDRVPIRMRQKNSAVVNERMNVRLDQTAIMKFMSKFCFYKHSQCFCIFYLHGRNTGLRNTLISVP